MIDSTQHPRVGVGVIIVRDGKVLFGLRQGAHGAGSWSLPGGHLEFQESLEACAQREVQEETGLHVTSCKPVAFTNDIFKSEDKHYITIFMVATVDIGEPEILEPEKCLEWRWCDWHDMPRPLFIPIENLLQQNFDITPYL